MSIVPKNTNMNQKNKKSAINSGQRLRRILIAAAVVTAIAAGLFLVAAAKVASVKIEAVPAQIQLLKIEDVPAEYWETLSKKKIFFAHREFGDEIIDGMEAVIAEHPQVHLDIKTTANPADFDEPVFAHARIGTCMQPKTKTEGFLNALQSGTGTRADIVMLKFCFMDLIWQADAEYVFGEYQKMTAEVKDRYPDLQLVHITVPLTAKPAGNHAIIRESAKLLLGRPSALDDNLRRKQYNDRLRQIYGNSGCLFDLALIESINPDGLKYTTEIRQTSSVLVKAAEYSPQGGGAHLNTTGRKVVAEQFLITLAGLANKS